ncbi:hypothetical protein K7432_014030 [Basidiobolus ranarum]|uniref:Uncharacterized protein n=1 Tax=Basidiobolus ranarum TaxID=34480 RepID=A0ABR2VQ03_9FUNG
MPKPVALVSLCASPGAYIPMLARLMRKNEHQQPEQQQGQEKNKMKNKNKNFLACFHYVLCLH